MNFIDISSQPNKSVIYYSPSRIILSKNNIRSISRNQFCGLKYLQHLFLFLNNISYIEDGSFSETSLQSLYIYGNNLKRITSETFIVTMRTLKYLYIFNNPVEDLDEGALSHLAQNSTVYLDCKNLDHIPSTMTDNSTIAKCLTNKTKIDFNINNFDVSVSLLGMACTETICEPCPLGYYGKLTDVGCFPCPPGGFYQDELGFVKNGTYLTDCKRCPIGTFSSRPEARSIFNCQSCPAGTNTDSRAALDACPCLENFHRTYRYGTCHPCPSGVDCTGGYQKLKAGYWWSWDFLEYKGPTYLGGFEEYNWFVYQLNSSSFNSSEPVNLFDTVYKGSLPAVHVCPRSDSCGGGIIEGNCSKGYTGWLCAECSSNYYELFEDCHRCQDKKVIIIVTLFGFLAFLGIVYGMWKLDKRTRRGTIIRNDYFVSHLKIAINFYQILGILSEINEIHWPESFKSVGQSLQYLDIVRYVNVFSPRCIFPHYKWNAYTYLYIAIATPFCIIVLTYIVFFIWNTYRRYKQHYPLHYLTDNFLSVTMMLLYLTYASTCSSIMAIGSWSVRTFNVTANGTYVIQKLTSDYSIDLHGEGGLKEYETNKNIAYGSLVYVIGFPLAIILVLYRRYKRHETVGEDERPETMGMTFFCKQYSKKFWYWEIIDMYTKAILALIANFKDDQASNMSYSLFITVILIALHLYFEPMKAKSDQRFQLLTLVFIIVNLSVGAIVDIGESVYTVDETILVLHDITPFILMLLNFSIVLVVFVDLLMKVKKGFWEELVDLEDNGDHGDNDNELSAILQPDIDSLSTYISTPHNY
ncbi:uncharacterized protein LOC117100191 [Anneissia japonica]|uniref:uncharacterized protein LOC117100191 n=1 Tax=Anneissia japonica TaxID=1529436 RepID=UPI001425840D|nr:uncharacterized protein LOC117100191 [Anneissia japonica]